VLHFSSVPSPLPNVLTSSTAYVYQKEERALPGDLRSLNLYVSPLHVVSHTTPPHVLFSLSVSFCVKQLNMFLFSLSLTETTNCPRGPSGTGLTLSEVEVRPVISEPVHNFTNSQRDEN
jgi:hypothetical protein